MTFSLHPRLEADTIAIGKLPLCALRLMNDARFPWIILVPRREDLREIFDLGAAERGLLIEEVAATAQALQDATGAAKMNVGAIGNLVPQLHLHVVARFDHDPAWPAPVWGHGQARPYAEADAGLLIETLARTLGSSQ